MWKHLAHRKILILEIFEIFFISSFEKKNRKTFQIKIRVQYSSNHRLIACWMDGYILAGSSGWWFAWKWSWACGKELFELLSTTRDAWTTRLEIFSWYGMGAKPGGSGIPASGNSPETSNNHRLEVQSRLELSLHFWSHVLFNKRRFFSIIRLNVFLRRRQRRLDR